MSVWDVLRKEPSALPPGLKKSGAEAMAKCLEATGSVNACFPLPFDFGRLPIHPEGPLSENEVAVPEPPERKAGPPSPEEKGEAEISVEHSRGRKEDKRTEGIEAAQKATIPLPSTLSLGAFELFRQLELEGKAKRETEVPVTGVEPPTDSSSVEASSQLQLAELKRELFPQVMGGGEAGLELAAKGSYEQALGGGVSGKLGPSAKAWLEGPSYFPGKSLTLRPKLEANLEILRAFGKEAGLKPKLGAKLEAPAEYKSPKFQAGLYRGHVGLGVTPSLSYALERDDQSLKAEVLGKAGLHFTTPRGRELSFEAKTGPERDFLKDENLWKFFLGIKGKF